MKTVNYVKSPEVAVESYLRSTKSNQRQGPCSSAKYKCCLLYLCGLLVIKWKLFVGSFTCYHFLQSPNAQNLTQNKEDRAESQNWVLNARKFQLIELCFTKHDHFPVNNPKCDSFGPIGNKNRLIFMSPHIWHENWCSVMFFSVAIVAMYC